MCVRRLGRVFEYWQASPATHEVLRSKANLNRMRAVRETGKSLVSIISCQGNMVALRADFSHDYKDLSPLTGPLTL